MSNPQTATPPTANGGAAPASSAVQGCPQAAATPAGPKNVIADKAYEMIGTSTRDIPGTKNGKIGCAAAVSMMFKNATGQDILPG